MCYFLIGVYYKFSQFIPLGANIIQLCFFQLPSSFILKRFSSYFIPKYSVTFDYHRKLRKQELNSLFSFKYTKNIMNITITTFINPFSFFCMTDTNNCKEHNNIILQDETDVTQIIANIAKITEFNHGQYVAIRWKNKWARGVVSMEKQILVWLIDYGVFLRPNEKNVCINLPLEYRKLPTKVFEASIQGVVPTDKLWSWEIEYYNINNNMATTWNPGAINSAQELIKSAERTYFKPIALLSTQHNDVVIGDLFLKIKGKGVINMKDELKQWPVFLEENTKIYIQNFSKFYTNRRRHRLSLLTPDLPGFSIPTITVNMSFEEYSMILNESPSIDKLIEFQTETVFNDSITVEDEQKKDKCAIKITPQEIVKYCKRYITLNNKEYNVLGILINKARDLNICDKYKDHDLKSIGRGVSFRNTNHCSKFYTNRRRHRSSLLTPDLPGFSVPSITVNMSFEEYSKILKESPAIDKLIEDETKSAIVDGSTVLENQKKDKSAIKITPQDIEKYSKRYITLNGKEYNVLSLLINKARDLSICDRYKDHDLKSVGRGVSFKSILYN